MKFPREFLQEIKDRLSLSDIIGQRMALKRAGREFKGRCPFHEEKTHEVAEIIRTVKSQLSWEACQVG
jgi:DNA primase